MAEFYVKGGTKLQGTVKIDASKNAILPIIAGSILCTGKVIIDDCPLYTDVQKTCDILKKLGSKITYENGNLSLDNKDLKTKYVNNDLTKDIRASIFMIGPILARFHKVKISYPGGCQIGRRGIKVHLHAFQTLGVKIKKKKKFLKCKYNKTRLNEVYFDNVSVGATENLIMFTCLNDGVYKLHNCAKEPEVIDLVNFLIKMGAKIEGAGTKDITVYGVKKLSATEYRPIPDRIMAGTMLIAGAITGGKVKLENVIPKHLSSLINVLRKTGAKISVKKDTVEIDGDKNLISFGKVVARPYPSFPTDLQSQLTALATVLDGKSTVSDKIFSKRFNHVPELNKMGAKISIEKDTAYIEGVKTLYGTHVCAEDLRGGVALVLASLKAEGSSVISNVAFIDRGYYKIEEKLNMLGADIKRV